MLQSNVIIYCKAVTPKKHTDKNNTSKRSQEHNLDILKKNGKVGKFASEKSWEPCSFG